MGRGPSGITLTDTTTRRTKRLPFQALIENWREHISRELRTGASRTNPHIYSVCFLLAKCNYSVINAVSTGVLIGLG
jgi:hypothetical protein